MPRRSQAHQTEYSAVRWGGQRIRLSLPPQQEKPRGPSSAWPRPGSWPPSTRFITRWHSTSLSPPPRRSADQFFHVLGSARLTESHSTLLGSSDLSNHVAQPLLAPFGHDLLVGRVVVHRHPAVAGHFSRRGRTRAKGLELVHARHRPGTEHNFLVAAGQDQKDFRRQSRGVDTANLHSLFSLDRCERQDRQHRHLSAGAAG